MRYIPNSYVLVQIFRLWTESRDFNLFWSDFAHKQCRNRKDDQYKYVNRQVIEKIWSDFKAF